MANSPHIGEEKPRGLVTSFDVARLAGVTQATVSRAINKPHLVTEATRRKVEKAMASLNYRPSAAARVLARGKNGVIGLMIHAETYTSHIFGQIVEGVSSVLVPDEYLLSIANVSPHTGTVADLEKSPLIKQHSCDGLLIDVRWTTTDMEDFCRRLPVPYVLINPGIRRDHDAVAPDDQAGAELAVRHLIAKGHRQIAYLTGTRGGHPSVDARERGYELAMYRAGLTPLARFNERLAHSDMTVSHEVRYAARVREAKERLEFWTRGPEPATAILTYSADGANYLMHAAYLNRWFVPEKISIMSCDDEIVLERGVQPVTAVNLDRPRIGREAAQMLLEKIAHPGKRLPARLLPGAVVERLSVAAI